MHTKKLHVFLLHAASKATYILYFLIYVYFFPSIFYRALNKGGFYSIPVVCLSIRPADTWAINRNYRMESMLSMGILDGITYDRGIK